MKYRKKLTVLLAFLCCVGTGCQSVQHRAIKKNLARIDDVVREEIDGKNFPGAVVLVGKAGKVLYCRAFGYRALEPEEEPMTKDTIFDIASMTKPIATATSILILADEGRLRLTDYVGEYLPEFASNGKEQVQIYHLLTHTSGLPAYTNAAALRQKYSSPCPDRVIEKICSLKAPGRPGEQLRYSCLGYITLAKIVEIVSGQAIDRFSAENIFSPLKMHRTAYNPPQLWRDRVAPTAIVDGRLLRGNVHDPLAALMAGVTGNAGLFSTAEDLSIYCRMLLNDGHYRGCRVLSHKSVSLLTEAQSHGRACGFDVNSGYSWIKGSFASERAFCHSGYTGTSIVCDPACGTYLIILTNRVHPNDEGSVRRLRTRIADIVFRSCK